MKRVPMNRPAIGIASFATLGLGVVVTFVTFVYAAGWPALLDRIAIVPFCPYALLCGACLLARSPGRAIANFIVVASATLLALCWYVDFIFLHPGSKSGLVFLLVPFFQLPAAILLLLVMVFTCRCNRPSTPNQALQPTPVVSGPQS